MASSCTRVGDLVLEGVEPGAVYLLRGSHRNPYGDEHETLHVISNYRRGQVRGYIREKDSAEPWKVRRPAYEGHWPEVDQAVANLIGEPLIDFEGRRVEPTALPQPVEEAIASPMHDHERDTRPADPAEQLSLRGFE